MEKNQEIKVRYEGSHPQIQYKEGRAKWDDKAQVWLFQPEDERDWFRVFESSLKEIKD
jgi:hypothetical protein